MRACQLVVLILALLLGTLRMLPDPAILPEPSSSSANLFGKTVLITGGSSGVGLECAKKLASRGAAVIVTSRSKARADAAASSFGGRGLALDLSDLDSVHRFAEEFLGLLGASGDERLGALILNAGMFYGDAFRGPYVTREGFDTLIASNHMGHFLLTHLLRPLIERSATRVVVTASITHWYAGAWDVMKLAQLRAADDGEGLSLYPAFTRYSASKLQNVLFAYRLQRELAPSGASVVFLTPGAVKTSIGVVDRDSGSRLWIWKFLLNAVSASQGGEVLEAAVLLERAPVDKMLNPYRLWEPCFGVLHHRVLFFVNLMLEALQRLTWAMRAYKTSPESYDLELQDELWRWTARAVGIM